MKKLITGLVLAGMALSHSLAAAAAQPAPVLERSGSSVGDTEGAANGGIFAVLAAIAAGLAAIIIIEENEDDIPDSP